MSVFLFSLCGLPFPHSMFRMGFVSFNDLSLYVQEKVKGFFSTLKRLVQVNFKKKKKSIIFLIFLSKQIGLETNRQEGYTVTNISKALYETLITAWSPQESLARPCIVRFLSYLSPTCMALCLVQCSWGMKFSSWLKRK